MLSYGVFEHKVQPCSWRVDWKMYLSSAIDITMCPDVDIKYHWTPAALYKLQTPGQLQKWEACLWTIYSSLFACSDCAQCSCSAPSSSSVALPWHGACGAVPRTISTILTGDVKDRRLGCGICNHGSLPVHLCSHLGSALNFWSSPCAQLWRMLNKIHPVLGNFGRSLGFFRGSRPFCGC